MKVKITKDDIVIGWAKSIEGAKTSIRAACEQHGFDISRYKIVDFDTLSVIIESINSKAQEQP